MAKDNSQTTIKQHQPHCRAPEGYVCCCVKEDEINVVDFMEKQFADPDIKAVYERLGKR